MSEWELARYVVERLRSLNRLHAVFGFTPVAALACAFASFTLWFGERRRGAPTQFTRRAASLAALACVAFAPHLIPRAIYPVYLTGVAPLLLVLVAWCGGEWWRGASPGGRRALGAGLAAVVVIQAGVYSAQSIGKLSPEKSDLVQLREVAEYLVEIAPPDSTLVTMDSSLAVESGLRLAPGWEMDLFSFFPMRPEDEALRYRVVSEDGLVHSLRSPAVGAVALSDRALGILLERRHTGYAFYRMLTESELHEALPALRRYRLERVFHAYGQFRDKLYILLPEDAPAGTLSEPAAVN